MQQTSATGAARMVAFYHDIEQDFDSPADPARCRRAVEELLRMESELQVPATYNMVGKLYQSQHDLVEMIRSAGQEVAFHSYHHQSDWQPAYYANEVRRCRDLSPLPQGYRSPRSQWDQQTLATCDECGFHWNAESDPRDEPYFIHAGLVRIPIAGDDWPLATGKMQGPDWLQSFARKLEQRRFVAFGSHDSVLSFALQSRLNLWRQMLEQAIAKEALMVTFSEATDLLRRAALAKHGRQTKWLPFGRSVPRRWRAFCGELIQAIAGEFDHPVVACLGPSASPLAAPIRPVAARIHVVEPISRPAGGKVDRSARAPLAYVGDLATQSVDLVIAAGALEFQFWPDRLANEIRRIGRRGARYMVILPAGPAPPKRESIPDRLRRYFTLPEIEAWSASIGPARLFVIPADKRAAVWEWGPLQPANNCRDTSQLSSATWILLGTITEPPVASQPRQRCLPLGSFQFRLRH